MEVMVIYQAAQWILAYDIPFTRISIFSDSLAAIKSLSNVANNFKIDRECQPRALQCHAYRQTL